ncbi:MAG: hypothetical protein N2749_05000 [Clostridia bacterium]|nr:hypothetical protein [Clostridia bacterium]
MYEGINNYGKSSQVNRTVKKNMKLKGYSTEQLLKLDGFSTKKDWEDFIFSLPEELAKTILLDLQSCKAFSVIILSKKAIRANLENMKVEDFCNKECISKVDYEKMEKTYMRILRKHVEDNYVSIDTEGQKINGGLFGSKLSITI